MNIHKTDKYDIIKALIFLLISIATIVIAIVFFEILTLSIIMFVIGGTSLLLSIMFFIGFIKFFIIDNEKDIREEQIRINNNTKIEEIENSLNNINKEFENNIIFVKIEDIKISKPNDIFMIDIYYYTNCKIKLDKDIDVSNYKDSLELAKNQLVSNVKDNLSNLKISYEIKNYVR